MGSPPNKPSIFGAGDDWDAELDAWDAALPIAGDAPEPGPSSETVVAPMEPTVAGAPQETPLAGADEVDAAAEFVSEPSTASRQPSPEMQAQLSAPDEPPLPDEVLSNDAVSELHQVPQTTPRGLVLAPAGTGPAGAPDEPSADEFNQVPTASGIMAAPPEAKPEEAAEGLLAVELPSDAVQGLRDEIMDVMWRGAKRESLITPRHIGLNQPASAEMPGLPLVGDDPTPGSEPALSAPLVLGPPGEILSPRNVVPLGEGRPGPFDGPEEPTLDGAGLPSSAAELLSGQVTAPGLGAAAMQVLPPDEPAALAPVVSERADAAAPGAATLQPLSGAFEGTEEPTFDVVGRPAPDGALDGSHGDGPLPDEFDAPVDTRTRAAAEADLQLLRSASEEHTPEPMPPSSMTIEAEAPSPDDGDNPVYAVSTGLFSPPQGFSLEGSPAEQDEPAPVPPQTAPEPEPEETTQDLLGFGPPQTSGAPTAVGNLDVISNSVPTAIGSLDAIEPGSGDEADGQDWAAVAPEIEIVREPGDQATGPADDDGAGDGRALPAGARSFHDDRTAIADFDPRTTEPPVEALRLDLPELEGAGWAHPARWLSLPEQADTPAVTRDSWSDQLALLMAELEVAEPERRATLAVAAARAAEQLGDDEAAFGLYEQALTAQPSCTAAARAVFRMHERRGEHAEAHQALARLAALAAEDRPLYEALLREWSTALHLETPEGARECSADRFSQALADAETALASNEAGAAARALGLAGDIAGHALGSALHTTAARLDEFSGAPERAAEHLRSAREAQPTLAVALGELRWAARAETSEAIEVLEHALGTLPPSSLRDSVARWAARLARHSNDQAGRERAARLLRMASASVGVLRDRLELLEHGSGPEADELAARAAELTATPAATACLALRRATLCANEGRDDDALDVVERSLATLPEAVPLALVAERIARESESATIRARAFRLWAAGDPARRAFAFRSHADLLALAGDRAGASEALRQVVSASPGDASFWLLAQHDVVAGLPEQAAAHLEAGADRWGAGPLGAALRERAAELRSLASVEDGVSRLRILASYPGAQSYARWTWGRAAMSSGVPASMDAFLAEESRATLDPMRRAAVLTLRSVSVGDRHRARELRRAALNAVSGYGPALVLEMQDRAGEPEQVASTLVESAVGESAALRRYEAACWLAQAGRTVEAMRLACDLLEVDPDWEPARELCRRMASVPGDAPFRLDLLGRARTLLHGAEWVLLVGEALEQSGDFAAAAQAYREVGDGALHADAELGLVRVLRALGDGQALCAQHHTRGRALLERAPERAGAAFLEEARAAAEWLGDAAETRRALEEAGRALPGDPEIEIFSFIELARAARHPELIALLSAPPPEESLIAPGCMLLAELLDVGRTGGEQAESIAQTAAREGYERRSSQVRALFRALQREGAGPGTAAVLERLAESAGRAPATAAILLTRAADIHGAGGDATAAESRLRDALAADGGHLAALLRLARLLTLRGDWEGALETRQSLAAALTAPDQKTRALVDAAAIAEERLGDPARAATLLRAALAVEPANEEAFSRLRARLEAPGAGATERRDELAGLLQQRMGQASNPFELASLRLARAELLASDEGGRPAAMIELQALLQKDPQNPQALARLADLQHDDGAFAEAADLLLTLAGVESDAAKLQEVYLKLARLYARELHDPPRAVGAFLRVLQLDPEHVEALRALSDLYTDQQETKAAIAVTDRLVQALGTSAERLRFLVRLGQLWEAAGDVRRSGSYLKRAASEAPRDPEAVGELARFYERTKDPQSRRIVLDRSVTLLREDLRQRPSDHAALSALVPLLRALPAPAAAASASQLRAMLSETPEAHQDVSAPRPWPLSKLLALGDPIFPPEIPPALRTIFSLLGEHLAASYRPEPKRWDVGRDDRPRRGDPLRDAVTEMAEQVGVRVPDLYVKSTMPPVLVLEPGDSPCLIVGATLLRGGPAALRFIAGRATALLATHLDLVVRGSAAELGVMLTGLIRLFVPDFELSAVDDHAKLAEAQARLAHAMPKKLRAELMPYAVELSGTLEFATIHSAVRRWANCMGLIACGDLRAALGVLAAATGRPAPPGMLPSNPEAAWLVEFALSPEHDRLISLLGPPPIPTS